MDATIHRGRCREHARKPRYRMGVWALLGAAAAGCDGNEYTFPPSPGPAQAPAALSGAVDLGHLLGTVTAGSAAYAVNGLLTVDGELRLQLNPSTDYYELGYWGGRPSFDEATRLEQMKGLYKEELAEIGRAGELIISVDAGGRLFFQSAATGCVGNGGIAPGADPSLNVFDARLTIEACAPAYSRLNGEYTGLSTLESATPWDYDFGWQKLWLSTSLDEDAPIAMTFYARALE